MSATTRKPKSRANGKPKVLPAPATWDVELWPLSRLTPYDRNAKPHSEAAVQKLATVIRKVGVLVPLVVDADGVILKGHRTRLAAMALGLPTVPVRVARHLSAADAKAWRIADNRLGQDTAWDDELLRLDLTDLQALDVDLGLTGFEPGELAALLNPSGGLQPGVDPDAVPETPKVAVTHPGDLIRLGRHRLLCGDATRADHWMALMGDEQADLLWTDPPYGVGYEAKNEHLKAFGKSNRSAQSSAIDSDTMTPRELRDFLTGVLGLACGHTKNGGAWYVAAPAGPLHLIFAAILNDLDVLHETLSWVKDAFVLGRNDYHYRHEPIFYGWTPGAAHYFVNDRTQDTVWEIPRPRASKEHPTMKPVELVARAIRNSSRPAEVVVDPFAGSGTTLIAAEQEGRQSRLIEIDPRYCDVICARFEAATGQTAQRPKVAA